jgi:DNA polymerase-3 subunit beta
MQITFPLETLSRVLSILEKLLPRGQALPILSTVLVSQVGGTATLTMTNLETGLRVDIPTTGDEGTFAVPLKPLSQFLRSVNNQKTLTMELSGSTLTCSVGKLEYKLQCFDASEYPIIPEYTQGAYTTLAKSDLLSLLPKVSPTINPSNTRVELSGMHLKRSGAMLRVAGTDSFRLYYHDIPVEGIEHLLVNPESECIIPGNLLSLIEQLSGFSGSSTVEVALHQEQFFLHLDGVVLVSRIIHGKYPAYGQIIPQNQPKKLKVSVEEWLGALKAYTTASGSPEVKIALNYDEGLVTVEGGTTATGWYKNTVPFEVLKNTEKESTQNYSFQVKYLIDALQSFTDTVYVGLGGDMQPVTFGESEGSTDALYLVMPIRR